MVRARLHVICGNCGCSDEFKVIRPSEFEDDELEVYISCKNCSTLHSLSDNAEIETTK